jgi:hypothetical protein
MDHITTEEEFREEANNLLSLLFEAHDCPACNLNILTMALVTLIAVVHSDDPSFAQKNFRVLEGNVEQLRKVLFRDGSYH